MSSDQENQIKIKREFKWHLHRVAISPHSDSKTSSFFFLCYIKIIMCMARLTLKIDKHLLVKMQKC